ncbi:MAG: site-specific integrase [Solidesulfovibrio sp.]|uniref:tyrosine-type recombinase/integrase n=1 Tax=Solidesulfovibrio sp. TaxID=2910990 RepID=UPI0031585535
MVYYHEHGKRRDKSFGRGEEARLKAEVFDHATKQAKTNGASIPDPTMVSLAVPTAPMPMLSPATLAVSMPITPSVTMAIQDAESTSKLTFGELSKMYLDHLRVSGRTQNHIKNLDNLLKHMFFDILGKNTLVKNMTYLKDIVPFIKLMQGVSPQTKKPRSQACVNRYCDYVDAIFNFGIEMELISKNPMKGRKKAKERPRDVQVGVDDLKRIMDHAEAHIRWAMEVCFNLGTRPGPSELFALRWEHVDFDAGTVRIYATKTKTYRTVPVTAAFLERLKGMREKSKSGYIVEYAGKPLTTIRKSFNNAWRKPGSGWMCGCTICGIFLRRPCWPMVQTWRRCRS